MSGAGSTGLVLAVARFLAGVRVPLGFLRLVPAFPVDGGVSHAVVGMASPEGS